MDREIIVAVGEALHHDATWHEQVRTGACVIRSERVAELAIGSLERKITEAIEDRDLAIDERTVAIEAAAALLNPARDAAWQMNEAVSMLRQASRCARFGEGNTELADEIDDGLPAMQAALEAIAAAVADPTRVNS